MRKLFGAVVLVAVCSAGVALPASADTGVGSSYIHPSEYTPIHNGAVKLGLTDAAFQKQAVGAVSFIFGIAQITSAPTAAPGGGNHTITTTYTPAELPAIDHVASVMHLSRGDAQKVSASVVAFLLALS